MFNPSRLALARKRRQMTKKALAEKAGISPVTLTRLETGQTLDPEAETVGALAVVLNYPRAFFELDDGEHLVAESVSFRSLSTATSRQRDAALAVGDIAQGFDKWISDRFDLPEPCLPDLRGEPPVNAAESLRGYWGIGSRPLGNVIRLLEAKGVRVFSLAENNKNIDAFSYWRNGIPYIFLNTFKSAERSRFDMAHELGHLVMHRHREVSGNAAEREADQFAGAFLIPRADLIATLPRVNSVQQLVQAKQRWGVSVAALARTSFDVGLVSDWHYRELCKHISRSGYRRIEPEPMRRDESILWRKVFESLWAEKISREHVAQELSLPVDELSALIDGVLAAGKNSSTDEKEKLAPSFSIVR